MTNITQELTLPRGISRGMALEQEKRSLIKNQLPNTQTPAHASESKCGEEKMYQVDGGFSYYYDFDYECAVYAISYS